MNLLPGATGAVSFNNQRATNLSTDTTTGDALSRNQSTLNSLAAPAANYGMNSHTLTGMAAGAASGQPLVYAQTSGQLAAVSMPAVAALSPAAAVTATSITINAPLNITGTNQILLAVISYQGSVSFTMPSGWVNIANATSCSGTNCQRIDYKIATGGEPSSYTWNASASNYMSGEILLTNNASRIDTSENANASGGSLTLAALAPSSNIGELGLIAVSSATQIGAGVSAPLGGLRGAWNNAPGTTWGSTGFTLPITSAAGVAVPLAVSATLQSTAIAASEVLVQGVAASQLASTVGSDVGPHSMSGASTDGTNRISGYSHDGVENVRAFGAIGDGVTADDAAIQTAINLVCADNTSNSNYPLRPVFLPPTPGKSYALSKPILVDCQGLQVFGAGENASALSTEYYGPSIITGSVPATVGGTPLGNKLNLTTNPVSGGGNGLALSGCSGNNCGFLEPSELLRNRLNGLSGFSIEFTFQITSAPSGNYNIFQSIYTQPYQNYKRGGGGANIGAFGFQYNNSSKNLTAFATTSTSGQVNVASGTNSMGVGTHNIRFDYDGSTMRLCLDGSLAGSTSASGTWVQSPWESVTLPDATQNGLSFPDQPNSPSFNFPAVIANIRISGRSEYASGLNLGCSQPTSIFTPANGDGWQLLTLTFLGCADGAQYCLANTTGGFAQYAYRSFGGPLSPNVWLGVRGSNQSHAGGLNVHDMNLCTNGDCQGVLSIWSTSSTWRNLTCNGKTEGCFNFYNNDWESYFENLSGSGVVGFEFGGATNHPMSTNLSAIGSLVCFDYIGTQTGIVDNSSKCSTFGATAFAAILDGVSGVFNHPFWSDNESSDTPWLAAIYDTGNVGPVVFNEGELTTTNGAPYVVQDSGNNNGLIPPITFNGTQFNTFAESGAAAELVQFSDPNGQAYADPSAPDLLINTLLPATQGVSGVALSNETGNPNIELIGGTTGSIVQRLGYNKRASVPASAPGAGLCTTYAVAGTTSGTCKLQVMCGTSTTPVTVEDNVGSGC